MLSKFARKGEKPKEIVVSFSPDSNITPQSASPPSTRVTTQNRPVCEMPHLQRRLWESDDPLKDFGPPFQLDENEESGHKNLFFDSDTEFETFIAPLLANDQLPGLETFESLHKSPDSQPDNSNQLESFELQVDSLSISTQNGSPPGISGPLPAESLESSKTIPPIMEMPEPLRVAPQQMTSGTRVYSSSNPLVGEVLVPPVSIEREKAPFEMYPPSLNPPIMEIPEPLRLNPHHKAESGISGPNRNPLVREVLAPLVSIERDIAHFEMYPPSLTPPIMEIPEPLRLSPHHKAESGISGPNRNPLVREVLAPPVSIEREIAPFEMYPPSLNPPIMEIPEPLRLRPHHKAKSGIYGPNRSPITKEAFRPLIYRGSIRPPSQLFRHQFSPYYSHPPESAPLIAPESAMIYKTAGGSSDGITTGLSGRPHSTPAVSTYWHRYNDGSQHWPSPWMPTYIRGSPAMSENVVGATSELFYESLPLATMTPPIGTGTRTVLPILHPDSATRAPPVISGPHHCESVPTPATICPDRDRSTEAPMELSNLIEDSKKYALSVALSRRFKELHPEEHAEEKAKCIRFWTAYTSSDECKKY